MPIPASNIVKVEPRVIAAGREELEMNHLYVTGDTTSWLIPPNTLTEFTSASAVAETAGEQSDLYRYAVHYFAGYKNKFASPKALYVMRSALYVPNRVDNMTAIAPWPAYVMGAQVSRPLADFQSIANGALSVNMGEGTRQNVTGIDLTGATSLSQVAAIIQTAIRAANGSLWLNVEVVYDPVINRFVFISVNRGADSSVLVYLDDKDVNPQLANYLGFTETAQAENGANAMQPTDVLNEAYKQGQNWVTFAFDQSAESITTEFAVPSAEDVEVNPNDSVPWGVQGAAWAGAHWGFLYIGWGYAGPSGSDIVGEMSLYDNTAFVHGNEPYAAFIAGTVASIDWNRINGAITLAFKRGDGLASTVNSEAVAAELESRNVNFYGAYATRNADFDFLYPGRLLNSDYVFIDPLVNAIWLNNSLQVSIMNGLTTAPRVPYTDAGFTRIRSWMMDPVNRALTNGVIEPGVTLSESQKSELAAEAGADISEELFTQGYYIQILDPGAPARVNRETPSISLWYTYGGAVQRITVASTVVL